MLIAALTAIAMFCPAALAADEAGEDKPKPEKKKAREGEKVEGRRKHGPALQGEYAIMAKVLKLDEATQAKIKEQFEANRKARNDWEEANGAKLRELRQEAAKARKAKDKEKVEQLEKDRAALEQAEAKLRTDARESIMALLTEEQRTTWNGFILRRGIMGRFKKVKLTDEQEVQMQKMCEESAKTVPPADAHDREARKARTEALEKLCDDIAQKVLTEEQRKKLSKPEKVRAQGDQKPEEKAKAEGKARGEGKAEGRAKAKAEGRAKGKEQGAGDKAGEAQTQPVPEDEE